jgi:RNA polymerase sigma-70 factor (ECF subfamily)
VNNVSLNRRFLETDDEEEACRLLFNEYYKTVFNAVDRMLGNHSDLPVDADDITSETFTKAFNKRKEIREPEKLLEWLITAAKNLMIDKMRRFRSQTRRLPIESLDGLYDSEGEVPLAETDTEQAEANRYLVAQLLRLLQDRDREIVAFMLDELSPKEIAKEIGSTPEAVQKRWERIRKWLEPVARNLESLVDCLPEENDRKIMERYLDGQPLSAIAKAIGISPFAVERTVKRVIAQWKKVSARQNPTDPVSAMVKKEE